MPKPIHFHKYEKFNWPNGKSYYKCILPGCSHYLPIATLAVGRETLCHGHDCYNLVVITREDITRGVKRFMCECCKELRKQRREELSNII